MHHPLPSLLLNLPLICAFGDDGPKANVTDAAAPTGVDTEELVTIPRAELDAMQEAIEELQASCDAPGLPFSTDLSATLVHQTLTGSDDDGDHLTASFDLIIEAPLWEGAVGIIDIEGIGGDGPDAALPTFTGWNYDAGSLQSDDGLDRLHVFEAFISTPVADDLALTFGKVDLTGFFDANDVANDETSQFLFTSFVNSSAYEVPGPSASAVLSYQPASGYDAHVAVATPDNDGTNPTSDVFATVQFGMYPELFGHEGSYHAYYWSDGSREDLSGFGVSVSQGVTDAVDLFGRAAWQDREETALDAMARAWSFGGQRDGLLVDDDTFGLAFGENTSRDAALETESAWELYYRRPMNEHMDASIHVMGVDSAAGASDADAVALVLRLQIGA